MYCILLVYLHHASVDWLYSAYMWMLRIGEEEILHQRGHGERGRVPLQVRGVPHRPPLLTMHR